MTQETLAGSVPARDDLEEKHYLLRRADQHRKLADIAEEPGTKHIHLRLASLYQDRADRIIVVDQD